MNNKQIKTIIVVLITIIVVFISLISIWCGVSACNFVYGFKIFIKFFAVIIFTIAAIQALLIPIYIYKLGEEIDDVKDKIDCVIVMLHNLKLQNEKNYGSFVNTAN